MPSPVPARLSYCLPCQTLKVGKGGEHGVRPGRVGASILTRAALAEFVAATKEAYVDKAVGLANDLRRLSVLRKELRRRLQGSPLGDAEGFAREVEAAYRAMWRRWCDGGLVAFGPPL